jgi:hypothetical protein
MQKNWQQKVACPSLTLPPRKFMMPSLAQGYSTIKTVGLPIGRLWKSHIILLQHLVAWLQQTNV